MNQEIINRLNRAADIIEAECYNSRLPILIGGDDIVVLGDQCRFYGKPAKGKEQMEYIKQKFHLPELAPCDDAFRNLRELRGRTSDVIMAKLKLPGYSEFSIGISEGFIVFDFSLSDIVGDFFVPLSVTDLPVPKKNNVPIGKTLEGATVMYTPETAQHCHMLIAGQTGTGKSVLANTILSGLARAYKPTELRMLMASGKPDDVVPWVGLPHLLSEPTHDPQVAFSMLAWLEGERRRRSKEIDKSQFPRIVIYIGECSVLVELNSAQFSDLLESLVRLGRSENITVIAATQRPRGDQVGTVMVRSQFPLVICGRMANPQDGYLALGKGQGQAEFLPGNGAFKTNNGIRFQAAFSADSNNTSLIRDLVNGLSRGQWANMDSVDLPNAKVDSIGATRETDVLDTIEWMKREECDDTSINAIAIAMGWGYQRAARTFKRLQDMEAIGTDRNENRRVEVFSERLVVDG